jgi:serine/threonine protein kinase
MGMHTYSGYVWLALELATGGSIAHVLSIRALNESEATAVLCFATRALQFLHAQSIVHMDVKAANLLLFADGVVKLADFGNAIHTDSYAAVREQWATSASSSSSSLSFARDSAAVWNNAASPPPSPSARQFAALFAAAPPLLGSTLPPIAEAPAAHVSALPAALSARSMRNSSPRERLLRGDSASTAGTLVPDDDPLLSPSGSSERGVAAAYRRGSQDDSAVPVTTPCLDTDPDAPSHDVFARRRSNASNAGMSSFSSSTRLKRLSIDSTASTASGDDGFDGRAMLGSAHWAAPELLEYVDANGREPHCSSPLIRPVVDVWSLGITAIELIDARPPYADTMPQLVVKEIVNAISTPMPLATCSDTMTAFITRCLRRRSTARSTTADLASDPLLTLTNDAASETLLPVANFAAMKTVSLHDSTDKRTKTKKLKESASSPAAAGDADFESLSESDEESSSGSSADSSSSTTSSSLSSPRFARLLHASPGRRNSGQALVRKLSNSPSNERVRDLPSFVAPPVRSKKSLRTSSDRDVVISAGDFNISPQRSRLSTSKEIPLVGAATPLPHSRTLVQLASMMQQPIAEGGIERKRRFFKLQPFDDSFTGQAAVDWVCANAELKSRRDALDLLQTLQYRGIIRHVTQSACVLDSPELYVLVPSVRGVVVSELRRLVELMVESTDPLPLRDVRVRFRTVRGCVSGSKIVEWIQRNAPSLNVLESGAHAEQRAIDAAQDLLSCNVLQPVEYNTQVPEQPFTARSSAFYRPSSGTQAELLRTFEAAPQVSQLASIGGDAVRETVMRARARVGGVPPCETRKNIGRCVVARDLITWLVANEPRALKSRALAVLLARVLASRGAFYDVDSKSNLVSDCAQQWLRFCEDERGGNDVDTSALRPTSTRTMMSSARASANSTLQRITMQLTPAALLKFEFEASSGVVETHIDALMEIVQGKPAAAVDAESARDPNVQICAARALLAQCFGFVPPDLSGADAANDSKRALAEIATLLGGSHEHTHFGGADDEPGDDSDASVAYLQTMARRRARIYKSGAFAKLVAMASRGIVPAHRELRLADIVIPAEAVSKGATAAVFKAELGSSKMEVALKRFCEGEAPLSNPAEFFRELALLALVRHKHLAQFLGARTVSPEQSMVFRYYSGGTIESKLRDATFKMPWPMRVGWANAVADALAFLHSLRILYRDVKSSNVLLDDRLNAYVCDFGSARLAPSDPLQLTKMPGTTQWMAPEVFQKAPYSESADVYSFGVFMCELGTRRQPFEGRAGWDIPELVIQGQRPLLPENAPYTYTHLLEECWSGDVKARPSMERVARRLRAMHREMVLTADTAAAPMARFKVHRPVSKRHSLMLQDSSLALLMQSGDALSSLASPSESSGSASASGGKSRKPRSSSNGVPVRRRVRRRSRRSEGFDQSEESKTGGSGGMTIEDSGFNSVDDEEGKEEDKEEDSEFASIEDDDNHHQRVGDDDDCQDALDDNDAAAEPSSLTSSTTMQEGGKSADAPTGSQLVTVVLETAGSRERMTPLRAAWSYSDFLYHVVRNVLHEPHELVEHFVIFVGDGATGEALGYLHESTQLPFATNRTLLESGVSPVYVLTTIDDSESSGAMLSESSSSPAPRRRHTGGTTTAASKLSTTPTKPRRSRLHARLQEVSGNPFAVPAGAPFRVTIKVSASGGSSVPQPLVTENNEPRLVAQLSAAGPPRIISALTPVERADERGVFDIDVRSRVPGKHSIVVRFDGRTVSGTPVQFTATKTAPGPLVSSSGGKRK